MFECVLYILCACIEVKRNYKENKVIIEKLIETTIKVVNETAVIYTDQKHEYVGRVMKYFLSDLINNENMC